MSKSRRSLVRSSLYHLRQLWHRREEARREVRRSLLGTTFEQLEPRLAMAITSPLPGASDHIHPILQVYLEGQQVVIPSNVGITPTKTWNPHTHDLTGTIHIGEGLAGLDETVRNTTLKDFFDIWSSATANTTATRNATAVLDTDLTDGTNLPRIMDRTVNPSTHVLRVYVKEQGDTAPELEYASNQSTNGLARPELYVPRDGDQIIISLDKITQEANGPSFQPIPNQTVLGGAPTWLGIDGFDPSGGPLTYTVSSSNSSLLNASITPTTNKTLVLEVQNYGEMRFQLLSDLSPRTVQHIETLVNNGEFETLAKFYRISRTDESQRITRNANGSTVFSFNGANSPAVNLSTTTTAAEIQTALRTIPTLEGVVVTGSAGGPFTVTFSGQLAGTDVPLLSVNNGNATVTAVAGANDFVIQGGPSDSSSSLGQFDDEFHVELQFTTPGLLAMAKSNDDTNDSQVFITGGPARFLDMQHSIFGVLTQGDEVRRAIQHTGPSGDGAPPSDIVITNATIITDTENAVLKLKANEGASGSATVTLTVSDGTRTFSQQFSVTITPDTANSAPFLNPIAPVTGVQGQPITIQLSATDVENNPFFFDASKPSSSTVDYTVNVNNTTGLVTITPPSGFVGTFQVNVGVRGTTQTTTQDQFDTQLVTVTVGAGAPTLDLVTTSDTGSSSTDNVTNATSLDFLVTNVTANATVQLLKGTTVIATGTVGASANSITLTVSNPGLNLGQGVSAITARQTVGSQVGAESTPLSVTYDTTAPTFTSAAPTTAPIGFDLAYNAATNEDASGVVYSLSNPPSGMTINPTTGVVTWTPTSAQNGTQNFGVIATDAAGNPTTQTVTVAVAQPKIDLTMTITRPDGTPITTLTPNQDFILHVFASDLRSPAKGVFSAYMDVVYDSTKATVTGAITYSSNYGSGRQGSTSTAGLIDEVGAFSGTSELGSGPKEIFSIPMRATGSGVLNFALNPADNSSLEMLVYGENPEIPDTQVHYSATSITVGSTFNAVNDAFTVNEDTQNNTIDPLANDASIGGAQNTLTLTAVGTTSNGGTVTITQNGTRLSYTPAANFKGTETFTYTAQSQSGETQTGTITMTVSDVNDPPVATNDTFSAARNSTNNVLNVLANDTMGVDAGETLRVTAVGTGSKGGTITIGANGANIVYAPATGATGTETFTYTISDRATGGLTATATVTVNISGLTANPDTATVAEDSSATTINVLANDALDPEVGGTLTITSVGTTSNGGTVSITQSGTRVSYQPAANFQGTETFTYTISDGEGNNATNTVTVTVTNVNDPPVATNDTLTAFKNTTATFDVLANDNSGTDPTENLIIDSVTQPATGGTISIIENGKKISFVPTNGFSGTTTFTYTIKDPSGATATATGTITVSDFTPSSLAGFVYFDVNNNGIKDAGEAAIAGVTITLTGTATAGSETNVNRTLKTGDDGSYKFENLGPGNYTIRQTQPLFTIDGIDSAGSLGGTVTNNQIVLSSLAQGASGTGYNFGEMGRAATTISLRDFFSSTSRNYAHAAFDSAGTELWHSTNGTAWQGYSETTFSLVSNKSVVRTQATNGSSQVVAKTQNATKLPVYRPGSASGNSLYYIPGLPGNTPATNNQTPVAVADSYSTPVNTALTVNAANGVLKNDTDAENNSLTAFVVTQPANGTLTLNGNGSFTFTPTTGFSGTTSFTYKVSDGNSDSVASTVTISVGTNGAPTGVADSYNATEDTALTVAVANGVLKNDTDGENNTLTATVNTQPTKGTLSLASDGSFVYTPNAHANGTDTFTYRASDGTNQSAITTVTITIAPVNDAPVAVNDSFSTTRNTPLTQAAPGVLVNDTDVDSTTLTVTVVTNPTNGTLTLNANGSFTYTPNNNFTGTDTFTYRVSDGSLTADAVATIAVNPPANQAPVANADTYTTDEDTALTVTTNNRVLLNDTDPESDPLTATIVTATTHGTVTLASDGTFVYTPVANFNGTDFFTYRANDGTSNSTPATVTITVNSVNDVPVGVADNYQTDPGTALTVAIGSGVLANDTDADGQTLTAQLQATTTNGTLSLNTNGSFTYTPNTGFSGVDTFTYKAVDPSSGESAVTTVTIVVNSSPVAQNDAYTTTEDTALTVSVANGVLDNDTDPNNDDLTATVVEQPQHGTVTMNADGSFTYTPAANFSGTDTFRYQATDGISTSEPATVTITVNPVNDDPVGVADTYAANRGVALAVNAAGGVLANDTDPDDDTLTAVVLTQPQHGTLTLNADGSFTYTAESTYTGVDTFTYRAEDGEGGQSAATTVTLNVNAVPEAVNDSYTAIEDTELVVTVNDGVLDNDTDANGGTLTATVVTQPQHGTLTLNANGSFSYVPAANFSGTDGFSYTVSDGQGGTSNVAAVTITVTPVNDAPVSAPNEYAVPEDGALGIPANQGVLANDTDADGDLLTATVVTQPANGSLTMSADGAFAYTPDAGFSGTDTFTYQANDGTVDGPVTTVTIRVVAPPNVVNDSYTVAEDTLLTVNVATGILSNDTDPENDDFTAEVIAQPAHGTLSMSPDGSFTYQPEENFAGTDSFTYRASDGVAVSGVATVTITVTPVNDVPSGVADQYTVAPGGTLTVDAASGVLDNDSDADANNLTAIAVTQPANGTLTLLTDGSFTYTPNASFTGTDTFTYRPNDGTVDGNVTTVTIAVAIAPTAVADAYTVNEDTLLTVNVADGVLDNDTDPDSTTLTAIAVTQPTNGTLSLAADGSFTYQPDPNFSGTDSFTYRASDGVANSSIATVTLTVTAVNDAPAGVADQYVVGQGGSLVVAVATGVLDNDTDADNDNLTAVEVAGPSSGTLTLAADGSFSYTPIAGFTGSDSFTYRPNDGTVDGNVTTVSITVTAAPTAVADTYTVDEDTLLTVNAANGVLDNDTDPDSTVLTADVVDQPTNGTLTLNDDGSFTYLPNEHFSGTDTFTYRANDGASTSGLATVTITVLPVNDPPQAQAESYNATEETPLVVDAANGVLANDTDVDGNDLNVLVVDEPTNGTLTMDLDTGAFTYTPDNGYTGPDSFTYRATDGTAQSDLITVLLTVAAGGGGEGEGASLLDAALLSYLGDSTSLNGIGDWEDAVDAAMDQLG